MRRSTAFLLFLCTTLPACADRVTGIADGDTLTVLRNREPITVRLANIDAPERSQAFGSRSKQALSSLCFGKRADLQVQTIDRYGRTVAVVSCDGINANRAMVEQGMAWVYPKYNKDPALIELQSGARRNGRGLWADNDPIAPWQWRKAQRTRRD